MDSIISYLSKISDNIDFFGQNDAHIKKIQEVLKKAALSQHEQDRVRINIKKRRRLERTKKSYDHLKMRTKT